jgi:hypothetical protein
MPIIQINLLKKFGISDDEINLYGTDFLLQYLKYHHITNMYGESTILFLGFEDEELNSLKRKAKLNGLEVKERIGGLTFVCVSENFRDTKRISKAKDYEVTFLNKNEFLEIFKEGEYLINKNENIYLKSVREEFRITKPLSNFDYTAKVGSFSFSSDFEYDVNLYKGTCNCDDFRNSKRFGFQQGDLRRYCKHMIFYYRDVFKPKEFFDIKKFILENCYALKKDFKRINLPKVEKPIYLSYDLNKQDCDIYFPYKNNVYEKYCYDFKNEYFDFDEKPNGYVRDLRIELNKIFRPEKEFYKKKKSREETKGIDANVNGCIYFFVFIVIILVLIFS